MGSRGLERSPPHISQLVGARSKQSPRQVRHQHQGAWALPPSIFPTVHFCLICHSPSHPLKALVPSFRAQPEAATSREDGVFDSILLWEVGQAQPLTSGTLESEKMFHEQAGQPHGSTFKRQKVQMNCDLLQLPFLLWYLGHFFFFFLQIRRCL